MLEKEKQPLFKPDAHVIAPYIGFFQLQQQESRASYLFRNVILLQSQLFSVRRMLSKIYHDYIYKNTYEESKLKIQICKKKKRVIKIREKNDSVL